MEVSTVPCLLRFRVSVNIEAESRVQFHLVYEELLARRGGRYTYTTNILPQLRLASYSLGLTITETRTSSSLAVRRLSLRPEAADEPHRPGQGDRQLHAGRDEAGA